MVYVYLGRGATHGVHLILLGWIESLCVPTHISLTYSDNKEMTFQVIFGEVRYTIRSHSRKHTTEQEENRAASSISQQPLPASPPLGFPRSESIQKKARTNGSPSNAQRKFDSDVDVTSYEATNEHVSIPRTLHGCVEAVIELMAETHPS